MDYTRPFGNADYVARSFDIPTFAASATPNRPKRGRVPHASMAAVLVRRGGNRELSRPATFVAS
jgi:hypothetical protein